MTHNTKKYHQLLIEMVLHEDWTGTVYRSPLFTSREKCIAGCTSKPELMEIASIVGRYSDDLDDLIEYYEETDPDAIAFIQKIQEWLENQEKEEEYFAVGANSYGHDMLFWQIIECEVRE